MIKTLTPRPLAVLLNNRKPVGSCHPDSRRRLCSSNAGRFRLTARLSLRGNLAAHRKTYCAVTAFDGVSSEMKQFNLLSLIFTVMVVGCVDPEFGAGPTVTNITFAVPELDDPADVEHAIGNSLTSDSAVVFVHVDWAIMEPQRERFTRFVLRHYQRFPRGAVGFHYVDCTPITGDASPLPLKSLPGWPGSGRKLYAQQGTAGSGDLIWIKQGVVCHVEPNLDAGNADELVDKTLSFFGHDRTGTNEPVKARAQRIPP